MNDFTAAWGWPQWAIFAWVFLSIMLASTRHGAERLETTGERKGKPERYNAFMTITRAALVVFILIAGGFFA